MAAASFEHLRFLVVEDNAFAAVVMGRALKSLGAVEVQTARTGREGLELATRLEKSPDVVLLDLRMPEMGGVELIERLADRGYPGHVIVTSGVDEETLTSVEEAAHKAGIRLLGCLPKPVDAARLADLLGRIQAATTATS